MSSIGCQVENEFKQREKRAQMAVYLSGLPAFDAVGEPATFAQRWLTWKEEFKLQVTDRGLAIPHNKKSVPATPRRPYFNNSIPADARSGAKDYDNATNILLDHYKLKKNAPSQETKPNHSVKGNKRSKID